MANLIQLVKSVVGLLVVYLIAATIEVSCGGKGKGSDIILYKNNLVIRGNKGKGNLVIAEKPHHHHGHGHGHHEEHHHGHHHHHEGSHHLEKKLIMSVLNDGKNKGKNGGTMSGGGMNMKSKGNEMSWEDLIMGGGKY